jgi:hypothetical protein
MTPHDGGVAAGERPGTLMLQRRETQA